MPRRKYGESSKQVLHSWLVLLEHPVSNAAVLQLLEYNRKRTQIIFEVHLSKADAFGAEHFVPHQGITEAARQEK